MIGAEWIQTAAWHLASLGRVEPEQLALIDGCRTRMNARVPADGELWQACDNAEHCWRRESERPSTLQPRLPFVGPGYPGVRVAAVAINSRDDGLPDAEIRTAVKVDEQFRSGHRDYGRNSFFHYWLAVAVHAAVSSYTGRPLAARPDPGVVADSLLASARLQAVQCSPVSSSRQTPTPEMVRTCPEFLLADQLQVLEPQVLLLVGQAAHRAIEVLRLEMSWETTWAQSGRRFSRGRAQLAGRPLVVLALHHPASRGWPDSLRQYLESLERDPLPASTP
jgi:hypothetical protein